MRGMATTNGFVTAKAKLSPIPHRWPSPGDLSARGSSSSCALPVRAWLDLGYFQNGGNSYGNREKATSSDA